MALVQGYLAHKKPYPPRTLQQAYAWGPMVFLGGLLFLMSEVPLCSPNPRNTRMDTLYSVHKNLVCTKTYRENVHKTYRAALEGKAQTVDSAVWRRAKVRWYSWCTSPSSPTHASRRAASTNAYLV